MTFVIAEAGVNHNGSRELALELVNVAAKAGADAVKFQTFKADSLVNKVAVKAQYQSDNTGEGSQLDMLKKLEMSVELHHELIQRCRELNLEFMSTAFDEESLDFLIANGMKRVKVPSGEITNLPFISFIASKNIPIILSTGMSTLEEIIEAVEIISNKRKELGYKDSLDSMLTILHCTSNYPAKYNDVNLNAMTTIRNKLLLPVGYSDHTMGSVVSIGAVALGATVIEKHFTISRDMEGPDHKASLEPSELTEFISGLRYMNTALGSSDKQPSDSELPVRELVRRSVTLAKNVKADSVLQKSDLTLMRPGHGIPPKELTNLVGKFINKDMESGSTICWEDVN